MEKVKKNVWILNHYAGDTFFDKGGRHFWFAKFMKIEGYQPRLFVANSIHGAKGKTKTYLSVQDTYIIKMQEDIHVPYVFIKAREYEGNGKNRLLNMFDYFFNVVKAAKKLSKETGEKPDVILASSVHPLTLVAGLHLGKHFGVPCICEVRDLWPESIVAYSDKWKRNNPLIQVLYAGEKHIYRKCSSLVFTMEGGYQYIEDKGWAKSVNKKKVHCINNGVDLEQFWKDCSERESTKYFSDDSREEFNVVYTGSIRAVNDIGFFLEVAKLIKNTSVVINIFGDGDEAEYLKQQCIEQRINNIVFRGQLPKKEIPNVLRQSSLLVFHLRPSSIQRYGLSLNKMFEYFAAEKPILIDCDDKFNPVTTWKAGLSIKDASPNEFAAAIDMFADMEIGRYAEFCNNAKIAAQHYDFKQLTHSLIEIIEALE